MGGWLYLYICFTQTPWLQVGRPLSVLKMFYFCYNFGTPYADICGTCQNLHKHSGPTNYTAVFKIQCEEVDTSSAKTPLFLVATSLKCVKCICTHFLCPRLSPKCWTNVDDEVSVIRPLANWIVSWPLHVQSREMMPNHISQCPSLTVFWFKGFSDVAVLQHMFDVLEMVIHLLEGNSKNKAVRNSYCAYASFHLSATLEPFLGKDWGCSIGELDNSEIAARKSVLTFLWGFHPGLEAFIREDPGALQSLHSSSDPGDRFNQLFFVSSLSLFQDPGHSTHKLIVYLCDLTHCKCPCTLATATPALSIQPSLLHSPFCVSTYLKEWRGHSGTRLNQGLQNPLSRGATCQWNSRDREEAAQKRKSCHRQKHLELLHQRGPKFIRLFRTSCPKSCACLCFTAKTWSINLSLDAQIQQLWNKPCFDSKALVLLSKQLETHWRVRLRGPPGHPCGCHLKEVCLSCHCSFAALQGSNKLDLGS